MTINILIVSGTCKSFVFDILKAAFCLHGSADAYFALRAIRSMT